MGRKKKKDENIIMTHEEYREMKLFYFPNNKTYKLKKDNIEIEE